MQKRSSGNPQYAFKIDFGKLYFISGASLFESNGYNISSNLLPLNEWVNVSFTYDSETVRFYVNGELDFENNVVDNFPNITNENVYIGSSVGEENVNFNGQVSEIQIWDVSLSQNQILSYSICPPDAEEEGLVVTGISMKVLEILSMTLVVTGIMELFMVQRILKMSQKITVMT